MCTLVGVVGCLLLSQLIKEVVLAVISRVCVDGMFCWTDLEVALCWVKNGKLLERLWIVIVGTYIRSCKPSRYPNKGLWCERFWLLFWGPSLLFQFKFKFGGFDATERFELVENVVNVDAKGKSNGKGNGKSSLTSCVIIQVVSYVDRSC